MVFVSSQGFWQPVQFYIIPSKQIQYNLQRNHCTNPLLHTTLHTTLTTDKLKNLHRIPNSQVDLSHFFNSQRKSNTHFPLTYHVRCLNFHEGTINSSCYHRGYLGFIIKLREHFRLRSLGLRDQKPFTWRRKFRLRLTGLSPLLPKKSFFLGKVKFTVF